MIKLCIFDLDGTTINSLASIAHFANETLKHFGLEPFKTDEYRHLAGGGAKKLMNNLIKARNADPAMLDDMVNDWLTRYECNAFYLTEPYEGITKMLSELKERGIINAIVTNKSQRVASSIITGAFGKPGELIDIAISEHPGMVLKPQPDELLKIGELYGISMADTIYIGDHGIDMQTGKNAGAYACGVTWGFHTKEHLLNEGADFIADNPNELILIIDKLNKENSQ